MSRTSANHNSAQLDLFEITMKRAVEHAVTQAFDRKQHSEKSSADPKRDLAAYPINMRIDQVAAYLNCDEKHIRNLIEEGALEARDISTPNTSRRCLRVLRDSVARYCESATTKALQSL